MSRRCAVGATSFNKSKRKSRDGKLRWPSTESVARVLQATGETMAGFAALMGGATGALARRQVPMLNFSDAGIAKTRREGAEKMRSDEKSKADDKQRHGNVP